MEEAGFPVRFSYLQLTRHLDESGARIGELARRAGVSKQAMGELLDSCEKVRLVARLVDPEDRRAKVIHFTEYGLRWLASLREAVAQTEDEMRSELGEGLVTSLAKALRAYSPLDASLP